MSTFTDNLLRILKTKGITQKEFLSDLHLGKNAISQWKANGNEPRKDILVHIAEYLSVTVPDLTGDDISEISLSEDEKEVVQMFRKMSPEARKFTKKVMKSILEQGSVAADPGELKQAK